MPHVSENMRAPLVVFVALGLAVGLAAFVAILIAALDDGSAGGGIIVDPSATPTEAPSTAGQSETPAGPTTAGPTVSATPKPSAEPTDTATPLPLPTSSAPQSDALALGLWANTRNEWWFSDLSSEVARYVEGQTLPFMVSWQAQPSAVYSVQVTYDCATDDAFGAIDYLSGLQDFGMEPLIAAYGPQATTPDGAIPVPETDLFTIDDGDSGVLFTYGGKFTLLPGPVQPPGDCDRQRSVELPIQALGDRVFLLGTLHLATDDAWGVDEGAASHDPPFGIQVVVSGVGEAGISIRAGTVLLGP